MDTVEMMRAFVAVSQEGTFTAAGRRLAMSTKLVSKYVAHLEGRLSTRLFNRTTRSVSLTEVGRGYLERCRPILDQIDDLEALVKERQDVIAGPIRMTAPTAFGSTHLVEALAIFMRQHPDLEVDLKLTDNRVALVEEGFDLAIRIGALRDSTLIAKKLSDMPLIVCASAAYLSEQGRPASPRALATHNCLIEENQSDASVWRFQSGRRDLAVRVSGAFRVNSPGAMARMVIAGVGIARCPRYVVADALEDGRLEQLFPDLQTDMFALHALYPPNRHLTARVRALIDHLSDRFRT